MPVEHSGQRQQGRTNRKYPEYRGFSTMADYLYMVDLSATEETASSPKYVDRLLVQLICDEHKKSSLPETDREASACELALSRYDPETTLIQYRRAKRYDGGSCYRVTSQSSTFKTELTLAGHHRLCRNRIDLIGHDQPFFANQGDAAVKEGRFVVFIANQFGSVQRTNDFGSGYF